MRANFRGNCSYRLKLARARLMMRGKGDTYQERKGACAKVQSIIIRGENGAFLTPSKRGTHQGWKKSVMRIGNLAFVDGGKRGIYKILLYIVKREIIRGEKGTYRI